MGCKWIAGVYVIKIRTIKRLCVTMLSGRLKNDADGILQKSFSIKIHPDIRWIRKVGRIIEAIDDRIAFIYRLYEPTC